MGNQQHPQLFCDQCNKTQDSQNSNFHGEQFSTTFTANNYETHKSKPSSSSVIQKCSPRQKLKISPISYSLSQSSTQKKQCYDDFPYIMKENEQKNFVSLQEVIKKRSQQSQYFSEKQIIDLIQTLLQTFEYFYWLKIQYHDYDSDSISYSTTPKIAIHQNKFCSGYQLARNRQRFSFLSAQLINQFLNKNIPQKQIPSPVLFRGDLFAIGCILLQACTLTSSTQIYHPQNYTIKLYVVNSKMKACHYRYHPIISEFILKLLSLSNQEAAVDQILNVYRENVTKLRQSHKQTESSIKLLHLLGSDLRSRLKPVSVIEQETQYFTSQEVSRKGSPRPYSLP